MLTWFKRWQLNGMLAKLKKYQYARDNGDAKAKLSEIKLLLKVASFFADQVTNKSFPQAKLQRFEYLRAAAELNSASAQYICALMCFDVGRFYETWHQSSYGIALHERYMKEAYQQAFTFLNAAVENKSVEALRYLGLAHIYGWGVPKDTGKGFQYILESIEMENAWSQATKIIEKLNLNSPEFFQALTRYQSQNHKG